VTVSEPYDWSELNEGIKLVENDTSGLTEIEKDPEMLAKTYKYITRRGYLLTFVLVIVWPLLSIPAGVFTESYFSFWVLVAIVWGFGATCVITFLPIFESQEEIGGVLAGIGAAMGCISADVEAEPVKEKVVESEKEVEAQA